MLALPGLEPDIHALLREMKARTEKGHPKFYVPFPPHESALLREYHACQAKSLHLDPSCSIYSKSGVQIAAGFTRIVVGDYGAYLEIASEQICSNNLIPKFRSIAPSRPVKYIWLTTKDGLAKVYHQQAAVKYADYKPGMYYVAPDEVRQQHSNGG